MITMSRLTMNKNTFSKRFEKQLEDLVRIHFGIIALCKCAMANVERIIPLEKEEVKINFKCAGCKDVSLKLCEVN